MDWTGLDELIEILEEYRKESRYATITVQIRDHEYVHVKRTLTESRAIGKPKNEHGKTESRKSMDR